MNIIIIGPAHPLRGGIAAFNERLCSALIQEGHHCQIISYSLQYPDFLFPGKTQKENGSAPANLPIFPLINSINPFTWWTTARYVNQQKPDIVLFRYWIPFMGPALGSIERMLHKDNCKIMALVDNLIPHEKRPGDKWLTSYFVKNIEHFIVMSESVKKDLMQIKPKAKLVNLPHPIYNQYGEKMERDEARTFLNIPKEKKVLLFFGLIRKYKGLDLLIEALTHVENLSDVLLVVAGEFYEPLEEYVALSKKFALQDKIIWHDRFIPNELVRYYFSACNLLVLPYRTATQSGVTQIAFHFETPVLITNVGGLGEIIIHEKNGLVAEPTSKDVATKLNQFFNNTMEDKLQQGMKREKAKYSWKEFTKNMFSLITK